MQQHIIPDNEGQGFTVAFIGTDIEQVNPIQYWSDTFISKTSTLMRTQLMLKNPFLTSFLSEEYFQTEAAKEWDETYQQILATEVPAALINLLNADKKSEQIRAVRGLNFTSYELLAFIFKAFTEYGFLYSKYRNEQLPNGTNETALPRLIHVDGENVFYSGRTALTYGQLKQLVQQRKVINSIILDRGDVWHSFYITYNSLGGHETWNNGQPHYHYLSDRWSISREEVVRQVKAGRYPTTSVHIGLLTERPAVEEGEQITVNPTDTQSDFSDQ